MNHKAEILAKMAHCYSHLLQCQKLAEEMSPEVAWLPQELKDFDETDAQISQALHILDNQIKQTNG